MSEFISYRQIQIIKESLEIEDIYEALKRRPFQEIQKETEVILKKQLDSYKELIKKFPKKAALYKAKMDVVTAKMQVLAAKKKLELIRAKFAQ